MKNAMEKFNPLFKRISDRISTPKIQLNDDHYVAIIVAYAPTLGKSEQNPSIWEEFYDQLNSLTSEHKKHKPSERETSKS